MLKTTGYMQKHKITITGLKGRRDMDRAQGKLQGSLKEDGMDREDRREGVQCERR